MSPTYEESIAALEASQDAAALQLSMGAQAVVTAGLRVIELERWIASLRAAHGDEGAPSSLPAVAAHSAIARFFTGADLQALGHTIPGHPQQISNPGDHVQLLDPRALHGFSPEQIESAVHDMLASAVGEE